MNEWAALSYKLSKWVSKPHQGKKDRKKERKIDFPLPIAYLVLHTAHHMHSTCSIYSRTCRVCMSAKYQITVPGTYLHTFVAFLLFLRTFDSFYSFCKYLFLVDVEFHFSRKPKKTGKWAENELIKCDRNIRYGRSSFDVKRSRRGPICTETTKSTSISGHTHTIRRRRSK